MLTPPPYSCLIKLLENGKSQTKVNTKAFPDNLSVVLRSAVVAGFVLSDMVMYPELVEFCVLFLLASRYAPVVAVVESGQKTSSAPKGEFVSAHIVDRLV